MSSRFRILDVRPTTMGDISLRRRLDPVLGREVHEVKLGEEYLMSSAFTAAEEEMARMALAEPGIPAEGVRVTVGGLGLGFTARAALEDPRVGELTVVEALAEVIGWHREGLIPTGAELSADPRCTLLNGDFFALARGEEEPGAGWGSPFHAVLLDIDHSPRHLLAPDHGGFYSPEGLRAFTARMLGGDGVFALWSNDPPEEAFTAVLREEFAAARAEVVHFPNPLQGGESSNTVYVASGPRSPAAEG